MVLRVPPPRSARPRRRPVPTSRTWCRSSRWQAVWRGSPLRGAARSRSRPAAIAAAGGGDLPGEQQGLLADLRPLAGPVLRAAPASSRRLWLAFCASTSASSSPSTASSTGSCSMHRGGRGPPRARAAPDGDPVPRDLARDPDASRRCGHTCAEHGRCRALRRVTTRRVRVPRRNDALPSRRARARRGRRGQDGVSAAAGSRAGGLRRRCGRQRRRRDLARDRERLRRDRARRHDPPARRVRRVSNAPRAGALGTRAPAHRARCGCRPGDGPRRRCRRLPPQAVLVRRAVGAVARARPAAPSPSVRPCSRSPGCASIPPRTP